MGGRDCPPTRPGDVFPSAPLAWDSGPLPGTPEHSGDPRLIARLYPSTCGTSGIPVRKKKRERERGKKWETERSPK